MTNALVLYLQKPKLDPSSSKCSYYWVTIYISKIIHFAYNSFNYNTVSKRIIVGTALRRCPVSRVIPSEPSHPLKGWQRLTSQVYVDNPSEVPENPDISDGLSTVIMLNPESDGLAVIQELCYN